MCGAAEARLAQARQSAVGELAAWSGRWSGNWSGSVDDQLPDRLVVTAAEAEALARALDNLGEPGAASVAEVFDLGAAPRREAAAAARANLETELRDVDERLAGRPSGRGSPRSRTTRRRPATSDRLRGTVAQVLRCGSWSGSPTPSTTRMRPQSRARCTGRVCLPLGFTPNQR